MPRRPKPPASSDVFGIAGYFLRPLGRVLVARGIEPGRWFQAHRLPTAALDAERAGDRAYAKDLRVPSDVAFAVFEALATELGDAAGVEVARALVPSDFGVLEYAARASATLGAAFHRVGRFHAILNDRASAEATVDARAIRFVHALPGVDAPATYVEYVLGSWVVLAEQIRGARLDLIEARFPHARPRSITAHESLFGSRLTFGAGESSLAIAREVVEAPLGHRDAELTALLDTRAATLLDELRGGEGLVDRIRDAIGAALPAGTPTLDTIARELGIGARKLKRLLADEGRTFGGELDAVRVARASVLLADPSLSLGEIAFALGFSEASAFHRAHRRWTGHSPRAAR